MPRTIARPAVSRDPKYHELWNMCNDSLQAANDFLGSLTDEVDNGNINFTTKEWGIVVGLLSPFISKLEEVNNAFLYGKHTIVEDEMPSAREVSWVFRKWLRGEAYE